MRKYRINLRFPGTNQKFTVEVEAYDALDALAKAMDIYSSETGQEVREEVMGKCNWYWKVIR